MSSHCLRGVRGSSQGLRGTEGPVRVRMRQRVMSQLEGVRGFSQGLRKSESSQGLRDAEGPVRV